MYLNLKYFSHFHFMHLTLHHLLNSSESPVVVFFNSNSNLNCNYDDHSRKYKSNVFEENVVRTAHTDQKIQIENNKMETLSETFKRKLKPKSNRRTIRTIFSPSAPQCWFRAVARTDRAYTCTEVKTENWCCRRHCWISYIVASLAHSIHQKYNMYATWVVLYTSALIVEILCETCYVEKAV